VSTLLLGTSRISELADLAAEKIAPKSPIVAVSGAMYIDAYGADSGRLEAAIATATGSYKAGVPHLFMLDHQSDSDVNGFLEISGGIVLPVKEGEGGLARPYLTAALVIDELVRGGHLSQDVLMVKVEGEKNIFGGSDAAEHYLEGCKGLDIVTGVRTEETWQTMPDFLALTESVLSYLIGQLLGISIDTPSGILVLGHRGRQVFLNTTDEDSWAYLIRTPFEGSRELNTGNLDVTFPYHPSVRAEENGSTKFDDKRRGQFQKMFDYAFDVAMVNGIEIPEELAALALRFGIALPGVHSAAS